MAKENAVTAADSKERSSSEFLSSQNGESASIEEVLQRLVEVEETAGRLEDALVAQKAKLAAESEEEKRRFDQELSARMEERTRDLEERMEREKKEALDSLITRTEQEMGALKEKYQKEHDKISDWIITSIKGVSI